MSAARYFEVTSTMMSLVNGSVVSNYSNSTEKVRFHSVRTDYKIILCVIAFISFVIGVVGNSLVIYILARYKEVRVKSVANYYIFNLALSDTVYTLAAPFFAYTTLRDDWIFGNPTCRILYIYREINKFASIFTLVALSWDRYLASHHDLGKFRTLRFGKMVCGFIWVISLAMCTPYILYSSAEPSPIRPGTDSCRVHWPEPRHKRMQTWVWSQFLLGLLIPLIIIVLSYCMLMRRLSIVMLVRGSGSSVRKPNRKMTITVMVVVATFLLCQLPHQVLEIVNARKSNYYRTHPNARPSQAEMLVYIYANVISQSLLYISACVNPIIYGVANENFRKLYKMALCLDRPLGHALNTGRISLRQRNDRPEQIELDADPDADVNIPLKSQSQGDALVTETNMTRLTSLRPSPSPKVHTRHSHDETTTTPIGGVVIENAVREAVTQ